MHSLICQLYGQTLKSLRGERSRDHVARRGEISPDTWRRWELGQCLPQPIQESKILHGLECLPLGFELAFLATARERLEQYKRERLHRTAEARPEHADLATSFAKAMTLQQATLESG